MRSAVNVILLMFFWALCAPLVPAENGATPAQVESYPGTVSFDFKNVPASEAVAYVANTAGIQVSLDSSIRDPITLKLVNALPERALDLIARQTDAILKFTGEKTYVIQRPPVMTVAYKNAPLRMVLNQIARQADVNLIVSPTVDGKVNMRLKNVPWKEALRSVVDTAQFTMVEEDSGVIRVVSLVELRDQVVTKVFSLKYIQPPDYYRPVIKTALALGGTKKTEDELKDLTKQQDELSKAYQVYDESAQTQAGKGQFRLLSAVANVLSPVGWVEYDSFSNAFIVTDIKPKLDEVEALLRRLDVPPTQVFIDTKFISTTKTDLSNFGIDWSNGLTASLTMGSVASKFPFERGGGWQDNFAVVKGGPPRVKYDPTTGTLVPTGTLIPENGFFTFGTLNFTQLQQAVNLLKADSQTKVMQAPKIMTLDNRESTIFVGSNIRYAEVVRSSSQIGTVTQVGIREATNSPVETGFQLLIIPHVIPGKNKILMTVIPQDESLAARPSAEGSPPDLLPGFERFSSGSDSIDLPQIAKRAVITRLMVDNGQTIVLGGLVVQTKNKNVKKIPFLGDIPVIRWLFRNEEEVITDENLLIFMTVRIVYNAEEADRLYRVHRQYEGDFKSATEKLYKDAGQFEGIPEIDGKQNESAVKTGVETKKESAKKK